MEQPSPAKQRLHLNLFLDTLDLKSLNPPTEIMSTKNSFTSEFGFTGNVKNQKDATSEYSVVPSLKTHGVVSTNLLRKTLKNPTPSSTSFEKILLSYSVPKYLNSILTTFFSDLPPPDTRPAHSHHSTPRHPPTSHPDPPFTSVELRIACSTLKPRKAPGPDHIPAWKMGRLALVPIILLSAFGKIFESFLCHRLSHFLGNKNLLHPLQFGFRRGKSPTIQPKISKSITSHQCCLMINLDIKSAFDHLWHPLYSPDFLTHISLPLLYPNTPLSSIPGSKIGPILWNIFFDPILSLPFPPGVHSQAFADDLQLIIYGDSNYLTHNAQISINLIIEWCLDNKLTLSPNKSSILQIFCNEPTVHIQNSRIPCVEDITILGVNFNSRFFFSPHLNKYATKYSISSPDYAHVQITTTPTLTYAAPILAEAAGTIAGKSCLRSAQRKFCINAIHGFRTVPTFTSFALLQVLPIDLKLKLLSSLFKPSPSLPFKTEDLPHPYSYPQPHLLLDLSHIPIPEYPPDILPSLPSTTCLESSISLSKHCTVFQAVRFALLTVLEDIRTLDTNLSIGIFSDCLSLLCTLSKHRFFHPIVYKCQILLHDLLPTRNITLHWVKGHSGIYGNCRKHYPKIQTGIKQWKTWDDKFTRSNLTILRNLGITPLSLKNTHKHIIPDSAITTGFNTGHTWIGAFGHTKSKHDRSSCRHCDGSPETTEHIHLECPSLDNHRSTLFSNCIRFIGNIPNTVEELFSNKIIWSAGLTFAHGCERFSPSNKPPQINSEANTSETEDSDTQTSYEPSL
ncbi:hypothetical protein LAZ67_16002451 [Cordylochernes scorpioides]|uniref:Reverse transcriptase domain-containing protein n=1 Tax=Cordylochernes scorpioides TaxID=51811 RepID=A0ABY6LBZ3_9ARAC|nr:hypothetical protein LAZ67_16002451 [Cordylochernes scorpioides]